eukprot:5886046-Pleurochrysis_carterae.AAC.1
MTVVGTAGTSTSLPSARARSAAVAASASSSHASIFFAAPHPLVPRPQCRAACCAAVASFYAPACVYPVG